MENTEENTEEPQLNEREKLLNRIHDECLKVFEELGVSAVISLTHGDLEDVVTFWNCHFYDAAKLNAVANDRFRKQVIQEIKF